MSDFCSQIWQSDKQIKSTKQLNYISTNEYSSWSSVDCDSNWSCEWMPLPAACRLPEWHALLENGKAIPNENGQTNQFIRVDIQKKNSRDFLWDCIGYLLASEWATSASNSRLFRIFLPLERSGTLTESIVLVVCILFAFVIFCPSFTYRKDNNGMYSQHNFN